MRHFQSSWSDSILARLGFRRKRRRQRNSDRFHMRRRPQLESLEERAMLASDLYMVTTLADTVDANDGYVSLREAITLAATDDSTTDNDTIQFDGSLFTSGPATLTLGTAGALVVGSDVTIAGPDAAQLTVDGNDLSRVFQISGGVTATISGMTISGGNVTGTARGAGIHNSGDLTINAAVFEGNVAQEHAGGIYNNYGKLKVTDSTFYDNQGGNAGGAISSLSNSADALVIERSTFYSNEADSGGAIRIHGASSGGTATIVNSTFSGNTAAQNAGAIRLTNSAPILTIVNSTITDNHAAADAGGLHYGGGSIRLYNSIVVGNTSAYAHSDDIYGSISSLSSNNLLGADESSQPSSNSIFTDDAGLSPLGAFGGATLSHSLAANSPAIDKGSNALALDADSNPVVTDQRGFARDVDLGPTGPSGGTVDIGAVEFDFSAPLIVSTLTDEYDADYSSGDLSLREAIGIAALLPGADTIEFDSSLFASGPATITLGTSGQLLLDSDVSIIGPGVTQLSISGNDQSRVMVVNGGVTATVSELTLADGYSASDGGAIYNSGDLTLDSVVVSDSQADSHGGAINSSNGSTGMASLHLINSTIDNNRAVHGAGLNVNVGGGTLEILGSTISNNQVVDGVGYAEAGGLRLSGTSTSTVSIVNSTFAHNRSIYDGGIRVWSNSAPIMIVNSTIADNIGNEGGGIDNKSAGSLITLHNTIVARNTTNSDSPKDTFGSFNTSSSHNLVGTGASGLSMSLGNQLGTTGSPLNPQLASFDDYGGSTKTFALLANSPAIDKGSNALALDPLGNPLTIDQRGLTRVVDTGEAGPTGETVDIGAFEFEFTPPIIVSTLTDEDDGNYDTGHLSLREALALAGLIPGDDTISFATGLTGSITLNSPLVIDSEFLGDVAIDGPGANILTIDAAGAAHVLDFSAGAGTNVGSVAFSGLTLTGATSSVIHKTYGDGTLDLELADVVVDGNGSALTWSYGGNVAIADSRIVNNGGSISHSFAGSLTVTDSEIADNDSGISVSLSGPATISGSTIAENDGTAISFYSASVNLINSTISNNQTSGTVGALSVSQGTATLTNVTVANNRADKNSSSGSSTATGGLYAGSWGTIVLHNTIVADNWAGDESTGIMADLGQAAGGSPGTISAASSYNLIGEGGSGGLTNGTNGNIVLTAGQSAGLSPLGYFGGATRTHALGENSPAIDGGDPAAVAGESGVPEFDQRGEGVDRVVDGNDDETARIDIGAFELYRNLLTVDTLVDEFDSNYAPGDLSLREALALAAAIPGHDTITFGANLFAFGPATITLAYDGADAGTVPDSLVIDSVVTIEGPSAKQLTISGDNQTRLFDVSAGNDVQLRGMTLSGGALGAIYSEADLTIEQVAISDNTNGSGSIVDQYGGSLVINASTISGNDAGSDGIIALRYSSSIDITNSTISGNEGEAAVLADHSDVVVKNATIVFNSGTYGGVKSTDSDVTLRNSIVARNVYGTTAKDVDGAFNSTSGHNLIGAIDGSSGLDAVTTQLGSESSPLDPLITSLGDFNGPTRTHALLVNSPAFDKGNDSIVTQYDQRGHMRRFDVVGLGNDQNNFSDIGAFEAGNPTHLTVTTLNDELDEDQDGIEVPGVIEHPGDHPDLSLREALAQAKANGEVEWIAFDKSLLETPKTITLKPELGSLVLTTGIKIFGEGADRLTIDANGSINVFRLEQSNPFVPDVTLTKMTITGASEDGVGNGLHSFNDFTMDEVMVIGNGGRGVVVTGSSKITNSTIANNLGTGIGGGFTNLTLTNVTVSGNAHGIGLGNSTATITNSTIAFNSRVVDPELEPIGPWVAGIFAGNYASISINNSIVAENAVIVDGQSVEANLGVEDLLLPGGFIYGTNNLLGSDDLVIAGSGNIVLLAEQTSGLTTLGSYGGPTLTHALLPGSLAIDAGNNQKAVEAELSTDQRGYNRFSTWNSNLSDTVDIGAYETGLIVSKAGDESDDSQYGPGELTLREAISRAGQMPGKDEITFDMSALGTNTILLDGSELSLSGNNDVDIKGPGADRLTIDANHASHVISIGSDVEATISGLTITGGYLSSGNGGGIYNSGDLTLDSVVVAGNETASGFGGGIYTTYGAVSIIDSEIRGNKATGYGGGLSSSNSSIQILRSDFVSNHADTGGGALNYERNSVEIDQSSFIGNTSERGGAIFANPALDASLSIHTSELKKNVADLRGGAIYIFGTAGSPGSVRIEQTSIESNSATGSGSHGGGVFAASGTLLIRDSALLYNDSENVGGGLSASSVGAPFLTVDIVQSTFFGNRSGFGGGIYTASANAGATNVRIVNSSVVENEAVGRELAGSETGQGGGIRIDAGSNVELVNSIVASNTADGSSVNIDGSPSTIDSSLTSGDPKLSRLGYFGGPTQTVVPLPEDGSLIIDKGNDGLALDGFGNALVTDQRGSTRAVDQPGGSGTIDIGSAELAEVVVDKADFNGDGRDDFATFDELSGQLVVFLGTDNGVGGGLWATLDASTEWGSFKAGDFNGDGRDDLLIRDSGTYEWFLARSESNIFHVHSLGVTTNWTDMYAGDFDGDGSDELLGREPANWGLLEYSDQFGARIRADVGNPFGATDITGGYYVGDVNLDGKDDLIGRVAGTPDSTWHIAVSQIEANGTGNLLTPLASNPWASWFNGEDFFDATKETLDADGPYQKIVDAVSDVYNNVELELYAGLLKGPTATESTRGGNDWDQAALLVEKLIAAGFTDAQIVSSDVTVSLDDARVWIGAKENTAVEPIIKAAFDAGAVVNGGNITFAHAFVRVNLPSADPISGQPYVYLDPSWKAMDFQGGIDVLSGMNPVTFDQFEFLTQAGGSFATGETRDLDARELPLEYYEDKIFNQLPNGVSLAQQHYVGTIKQRVFEHVPEGVKSIAAVPVTPATTTAHGTFAQIIDLTNVSTDEKLAHRIRIWADNGDTTTYPAWTAMVPAVGLSTIEIENVTSGIWVNGTQIESGAVDPTLHIEVYAPEIINPSNDPVQSYELVIDRSDSSSDTMVLALGAGQYSVEALGDKLQDAIETQALYATPDIAYVDEFLAYAGAKYWYDVDVSSDAIAALTHARRIQGVQAALVRATGNLGNRAAVAADLSRTPFNLLPETYTIDVFRALDGQNGESSSAPAFLNADDGLRNGDASKTFILQYSALEHSIIEETTNTEAISAVKLLQMAYSGMPRVNIEGHQNAQMAGDNFVIELRYVVSDNKVQLWYQDAHGVGAPSNPSGLGLVWESTQDFDNTQNWRNVFSLEIGSEGESGTLMEALRVLLNSAYPAADGESGPLNTPGSIRYELDLEIAKQVEFVSLTEPTTILVPRARVRVGDSDLGENDPPGSDREWWQGTSVIAIHPKGEFRVGVFKTGDDYSPLIDGGDVAGYVLPVHQPNGSFVGDAVVDRVGIANGNVTRQETDIVLPSAGVPLDLTRTYNSQFLSHIGLKFEIDSLPRPIQIDANPNVGFGPGWAHSLGDRLINAGRRDEGQGNPDLIWYTSTGEAHLLLRDGGLQPPVQLMVDISHNDGSDIYRIYERDGTLYEFDEAKLTTVGGAGDLQARLARKVDADGNGFEIQYKVEDDGKTDRIDWVFDTHDGFKSRSGALHFQYGADDKGDRITSITKFEIVGGAYVKRGVWEYEYESSGRLKLVTSASDENEEFIASDSIKVQYFYHDISQPARVRGLLSKVIEPDGQYMTYDYTGTGRAYRSVRSIDLKGPGDLDDVTATTLYTYNFVQNRTQVIDPLGRTETFVYQDNGLVTRNIHADRTRFDTVWGGRTTGGGPVDDGDFLISETTDEAGAVQRYRYLNTGNIKHRQLETVESKRYRDVAGSLVGPVITTRYSYESDSDHGNDPNNHWVRVSTIEIDPSDASTSRYTFFEYDETGKLLEITESLMGSDQSSAANNRTKFQYYDLNPDFDEGEIAVPAGQEHLHGKRFSMTEPKGELGSGQGVNWRILRDKFLVDGGFLQVKLDSYTNSVSSSNKEVSADAVRIDRLDDQNRLVSSWIIDNGNLGSSGSRFWSTDPGETVFSEDGPAYFQSAIRLDGNESGTWRFEDLESGYYRVSATWTSRGDQDESAHYEISGGPGSELKHLYADHTDPPNFAQHPLWIGGGAFSAFTTYFGYDSSGNVTFTSYEGLPQTTAQYDHNGRLLSMVDQTGVVSAYKYDVLGRQREAGFRAFESGLSNERPTDLVSKIDFDTRGRVISATDPLGNNTSTVYNGLNQVVQHTNPDGTSVSFAYDKVGNLISRTDELGRTTLFSYDSQNRLIQTVRPDGATEIIRYDGVGRIAESIDAAGHATSFTYDAVGRLTETVNANPDTNHNTATNSYDGFGQLKWSQDFNGNYTTIKYDRLGRVTEMRVLEEGVTPSTTSQVPVAVTTYDYDRHSNLIRTVEYDAPGIKKAVPAFALPPTTDPRTLIPTYGGFVHIVDSVYDTQDRSVATFYLNAAADGSNGHVDTRTIYDAAGRVRFTFDELDRPTEFQYDDFGRLQTILRSDPDGLAITESSPTLSYSYDAASNVVAIVEPNGHVTTTEYDVYNRAVSTTDAEGNTSEMEYDVAGQMIASISALGQVSHILYDNRGRIVASYAPDPDGAGSQAAPVTRYEYNEVGNVTREVAPNGHEVTYKYDELNRLIEETYTVPYAIIDSTAIAGFNEQGFRVWNESSSVSDADPAAFGGSQWEIKPRSDSQNATGRWMFLDIPAGTYRVLATWTEDSTLSAPATGNTGSIRVNAGSEVSLETELDFRFTPSEIIREYAGQWYGWVRLGGDPTEDRVIEDLDQSGGDNVEIFLNAKGSNPNLVALNADAVMLERVVTREYAYDGNGNLKQETDTLGRATNYKFDELDRLLQVELPDPDDTGGMLQKPVTDYEYDGYGNVKKIIERRGALADRTELRTYDKRNRLTRSIANYQGGQGTYNSTATDQNIRTEYTYDDAGNLKQVIDAEGSAEEITTDYTYDNLNRLKSDSITDGTATHRTEYRYDSASNLTEAQTFIDDGTNETSSLSTYEYDDINRLIRQVDDVGTAAYNVNSASRFEYDGVSNLVAEIDATGRRTTYEYDRLNRLVKTTQPDPSYPNLGLVASTMTYAYDVLGNVLRSTNGEGETTRSIYDSLGREIVMIDANGDTTQYVYDSESNLSQIVDAVGNITDYSFDRLDRVETETIYDNQYGTLTRAYEYDDGLRLATTEDRNGRVTRYEYDGLDQLVEENWFDDDIDTNPNYRLKWEYDALGRLVRSKQLDLNDSTGAVIAAVYVDTFEYDTFGRLTERRNFDPMPPGGETQPSTPHAEQLYTYDLIGATPSAVMSGLSVTQRVGSTPINVATTEYSFDRLDRLVTIDDDVLESAATGQSDKLISFAYDAAGRTTGVQRRSVSNSFQFDTMYAYDGAGRLSSISYDRDSNDTPTARFAYQYDLANRITAIDSLFAHANVGFSRKKTFQYDDAGQLENRTADFKNTAGAGHGFAIDNAFTFDENGNRTSTSVDGATATAVDVDDYNRLNQDADYDYTYDEEGNLKRRDSRATDAYTEYTWDHRNRLIEVEDYNASLTLQTHVKYTYNNDDLRVKKQVLKRGGVASTEVEHYVYDGDQVSMILDSAGKVDHRRLYAPGVDNLLVDEVFNDAGTVGKAERGYWAVTDHAGTVHEIVQSDADGVNGANHSLVQHLDYDASGKIVRAIDGNGTTLASLDQLATDVAFAGRDWDNDASLYYNRARWYDANSGRFISEDPIGFSAGDPNLYRYANNDPANFRDPSGQFLAGLIAGIALQALDQQINGNEGSTTLGFMVGVDSGGVVAFEATYDANGITTTVSSPSGSNASQTSGSKRTPVEEADLWAGRLVEQFEVRNGSLPAGQRAELFDAYRDHQLEMYLKGPHANDFVLPQFAQFVQETNDAIRYPGPQWGTISKEQIEFSNAAMEERRYQELASKVDPTIKELAILEERYNTEHPGEALRGAAWNALLALGGFYAGARNSNNLAGLPGTTGSPTKVQTVDPKVQTTELVQPGGMPSSQRPAIKLGPGPYGDYYEGKANSSKATAAPNQGSWQPGNNINAPTSKGTPPSDRTVGRRFWKNEALSPSRADYMPADFVRMRKGLPPQRYNPDKGGVESMERSHEPVPRRDGGKDMVPRWPQEHAEVDPQRRPGY